MGVSVLFPTGVGRDVVPLGHEYRVDDDGFRSDVVAIGQLALAAISPATSLAVLGEPGIGKSRALQELTSGDGNVIHIGLEAVADVRELRERLGAVDKAVADGIAPDHLTLVLDSIDESPIPTKSLTHHLEATLQRHPTSRVVLGCRTADWSDALEARLKSLLPNFEVVELLPLGRADIATLAATRGVASDAFLTAVVDASAAPLAALPLTLDLLLVTYQQAGRLPGTAVELYEQGLLRLVEDPDPDREPDKKPAGSAPQRLAVAAKLAAYTMLCGRSAIARTGPGAADDLLAGALAAGAEPIDGGDFGITAELVDATLATALLTGRGPGRLTIVHASIAAYLTARYLTMHDVPEHQSRALLTRTNSLGRTRVPSRLRETAAWLVALEPDRNRWLVDVDPDTLAAHSGLVNVAALRRILVAYLLDAPDPELRTVRRRWRLAHPGLAEQLRPALRAPLTKDAGPHLGHPVSRRAQVAAEIARRAGGHDSVPDLVDLLLSSTTNSYLRSSVAYALTDLDSATAARTLRSVLDEVTEHPDHDPDDELRGLALEANWPANLTAAELVNALTHPQHNNYIGAYALFLGHFLDHVDDPVIVELVRTITPTLGGAVGGVASEWFDEDDPPMGMASVASLGLLTGTRRGARVMTALIGRAMGSAQLDAMVDEVGWLLATAVRHHHDIAVPARFDDPDDSEDSDGRRLRRDLVLAAMRHMPADRVGLLPLRVRCGGTTGLLVPADLDWLLSLGETDSAAHAARLIRYLFDDTDVRQQALVWTHRGEQIFSDSVGHLFDAVDLESPKADRMREEYEWSLECDHRWDGAAAHESALRAAWARCEKGDPEGFLALCEHLRIDPKTGAPTNNDDLRSWPSFPWLPVDESLLQACAERYLYSGATSSAEQFDQPGRLPYRSFVGYVALAYLARCLDGGSRLEALPERVWQRWTPAVLRFFPGLGDSAMRDALRLKAHQRAPDAYREWALRTVEVKARGGWSLGPLDDLEEAYDDDVGGRLDAALHGVVGTLASAVDALGKLAEPSTDPKEQRPTGSDPHTTLSVARGNAAHLARFLVRRHRPTVVWLRGLSAPGPASLVETRVLAIGVLLPMGLVGWESVFAEMQSDDAFGVALAIALGRQRGDESALTRLNDWQLAELWLWLDSRWSSQTDAVADGYVTDDQHVRDWRNDVVAELQARATPDALSALARLVSSRPGDYRLQAALADAEARDSDENWQGVKVAELTALLANGRRTLVNDDDALFRALLASLDRFALRMRDIGQTLWNESRPASSAIGGARVWNPKYEPDVSAALRDHLAQEFGEQLVVNREVLVKQTTSRGHGLSVDVLPTATDTIAGRRLPSCPIEVKCCWNAGLLTDLQDQLVADYLPATGATRGVYVCAWFPTAQWDDLGDSRRTKAAARDRDQVMRSLTEAAKNASQSGEVEVVAVVIDIPRPTPSSRATGVSSDGE